MKKIKGKLVKRSSQTQLNIDSSLEWSKYDERVLECIQQDDLTKLKSTLAKKGVSVVKLSPNGTTALHLASEKEHPRCLEILLSEKPDLSVLDKTGCNALSVAAKVGSLECMVQLLHYNNEIVGLQDYHKRTALHYAAAKGHYECVQFLLDNNQDLDIRDKDGRTPLLMGIQSGKEEVVKLLLDKGAKVNITDNSKKTSLMYASLLGHEKSVDLLLKRGANSKLQDNNEHTAEDYARIIGYKSIIDMIKNAPTVATWDAVKEDDDEEEDQPEIPNGELVSAFSLHEDPDDANDATAESSKSNSPMHTIRSIANDERSSLAQDSFSSKNSSLMMQRDLTNDVKELEEENEMLNQELSKLRIQHQKTIERLRIAEENLNSAKKNSVPPDLIHVNGLMDDDLLERKERKIEDLENQVSKLNTELIKQTKARENAEKNAETLSIQVTSYKAQVENNSIFNSDDENDVDLPGDDRDVSNKVSMMNDEISKLRQQNVKLTEQLKKQVTNEINHNDDVINEPTISLVVYQQLKDSSEEEIFSLSEQIEELKVENEELEMKVSPNERCQSCANRENESNTSPSDSSHKHYLESEVKRLRKQLKEKESEFKQTINLYRLHLVSSVQGELDPSVEESLQLIINLRASEQFC